jgi:TonB-linked SusC/RagA family outer membrane protein
MSDKIKNVRYALVALLLFFCAVVQAQTVSGNVKDALGDGVIGATVMEQGTKNGTVTDMDGNFTIKLQGKSRKLVFSYVGMKNKVVDVAGKSSINVVLEDDANTLNDLVVVGYGTVKKNDLTGSVSSVGTEQLNAKGAPSVMESLQGATPGVNITPTSGRVGEGFKIEIRGASSVNSATTPLYVVDGVMCDDIDWLNTQDIERIDILKEASSTAIYGSRATAGVVMVTTKGGSNVKKQERATISYDGYYGWTKTARMPEFMDGQEFYNYRFLKFLAPSVANTSAQANPAAPTYGMADAAILGQCLLQTSSADTSSPFIMKQMLSSGKTYDWPDLVTRTGEQQNHYLAVKGSSEKINYHVGLGYNIEKGIYEKDD